MGAAACFLMDVMGYLRAIAGCNVLPAPPAAHCLPVSLNLCKKFFQIFYLFKMHVRLYDIPCKR